MRLLKYPTKYRNAFLLIVISLFLIPVSRNCQKFEPQSELVLITGDIEAMSGLSYQATGNIINMGEGGISQHGFCWSETPGPTVDDASNTLGEKATGGPFTATLSDFEPATTYYIRAYATSGSRTEYGKEKQITTQTVSVPSVTTSAVSSITSYGAVAGGEVTSDGGSAVTARGVVWSTSENPTLTEGELTTDGTGTGSFSSTLEELDCNTTYYVRAYATNMQGTAYGSQVSFTSGECPEGLPVVTTAAISSITDTSAIGGGEVTGDGGEAVTAKGIVWSTGRSPDIGSDRYTTDGTGIGTFASNLTGLDCGTTYYVRAYATNANGTSYGNEVSFVTMDCPPGLPVVTTSGIMSVTDSSATGGGEVIADGGYPVTAKGIVWSTSQQPVLGSGNSTTDGTGIGTFASSLTGLECGTAYYVRAYATNENGTSYGSQVSFSTSECPPGLPEVTTAPMGSVTAYTAEGGGEVTGDGGSQVTSRGIVWSTSANPDIGDNRTEDGTGTGSFTSTLEGLDCNTTYYVRAYATNSVGTAYGSQVSFNTTECPVEIPTVTTRAVSNITQTTADGGGEVTDSGGGIITVRGVCYGTSPNPDILDNTTTDGTGTGWFDSNLYGLSPNTTYYVRAYATNSAGTGYGSQVSFTTLEDNTVTDIDGNVYQTVQIGDQVWMAENLKVTRFPDGTPIPHVEDYTAFEALEYYDPAYNWYDNSTTNRDIYGGLYTWAAAVNGDDGSNANPSGLQGVCPDGWHLPSDEEWKDLERYLGMSESDIEGTGFRGTTEGGKLKEAGTDHWNSPNGDATNESGFTALGAGQRHHTDDFNQLKNYAYFWTSSEETNWVAHRRVLSVVSGVIGRGTAGKDIGRSVRCVKD